MLSGFSRELAHLRCPIARGLSVLSRLGWPRGFAYGTFAPTRFNRLFRQPAGVTPLRPRVAPGGGNGILTVCPSGAPRGSPLGPDLP